MYEEYLLGYEDCSLGILDEDLMATSYAYQMGWNDCLEGYW